MIMSATKTAFGWWNIKNYLDSEQYFPPSAWTLRENPTSSSIKLSLNLGLPNLEIWADFSGNFSSNILSTVKTGADLVTSAAEINGYKAYLNNVLLEDAAFSSPLSFAQSGWSGTQDGYAAAHAGDDLFIGSTSDLTASDKVYGYAGNDIFYPNNDGASDADIVNGGEGRDSVVYRGTRDEYSLESATGLTDPLTRTQTQIGFRITDTVAGRDGDDELIGIERLQFSDMNIALDASGVAGQTYRIYKAALDRAPDTQGLGYWIAQMDKGMDLVDVAARFIDSDEFRMLYGQNPSNAEFLTKIYSNVLDRTPDEAGLTWWLNEMNTNPSKTWQKVLADFSESSENQANVASLIANGIAYDLWG